MKALLTGFDAFGGALSNPSGEIALALAAELPPPPYSDVTAVVLPTVYSLAAARIIEAIEQMDPDVIVLFGLAASAAELRLERFALNVADSPEQDNAGSVLTATAVVADGPDAFSTRLDLATVAGRASADGHSPSISNHAGTFVCNYVYYTVLHRLAATGSRTDALFVHVPWSLPAPPESAAPAPGTALSLPVLAAARAVLAAVPAARRASAA